MRPTAGHRELSDIGAGLAAILQAWLRARKLSQLDGAKQSCGDGRAVSDAPSSSLAQRRALNRLPVSGSNDQRPDVGSHPMGSVNKVILVGSVGRDAELRYTPAGGVSTLNLATTKCSRTAKARRKTQWHRVILWGKTAECCRTTSSRANGSTSKASCRPAMEGQGQQRQVTLEVRRRVVLLGGRRAVKVAASAGAVVEDDPASQSEPGGQWNSRRRHPF